MKKIGITGSIASGKTTASKLLSKGRGPLFSADDYVKKLYKKKYFKRKIVRKLGLKNISNFKKKIREKISIDNSYIKKLEKIIHPLVRKEMRSFIKRNKNRKFVFFEIPLLIESKLMRNFDEPDEMSGTDKMASNQAVMTENQESDGFSSSLPPGSYDIIDKEWLSDILVYFHAPIKYIVHYIVLG